MRIDAALGTNLAAVPARAREIEAEGYDGAFTYETNNDPFLAVLLAAEHTDRIDVGTSIAVAFARTPMTTATTANELQRFSRGRFVLGLGSQIKPHIERRFSMPWSRPVARMREFVLAMRAIWAAWQDGTKLDFRGEFYTHTLMTPFFAAPPHEFGSPAVLLAGVGERMTAVAGEVADGLILHSFTTERYVREVTVPALEAGFATGGRTRAEFQLSGPLFVVTGANDEEMAAAAAGTRAQIAFYGSTPGYHGVLDLNGWGETGTRLNAMSKRGEWEAMGELITDEMLEAFAVVAPPDAVAPALLARYGDLVDRVAINAPYHLDPDVTATIVAGLTHLRE
jgi:probable F420-dependent oxidoreductase